MALIIPPGFLQAVYVMRLTGDSEDMVTTCGHELDGASGANAEDAADDLFGAFAANIMEGFVGSPVSLVAVDVYIGSDGPNVVNSSTEPPYPGGGSATLVPQNTAFLVRKRTDLGGRRGRGRMYIPGVAESTVDNVGDLADATVTGLQVSLDNWYAALTSAVGARYYPPVVLHRSEGAGIEPAPTPITRFVMEKRVATQRRRLRP